MDDKWFKEQQKKAGVTAEDIARRAGRVRSAVSHIYSGRQRMNLEWATAFADALGVPLSLVLEKAGIAPEQTTRQLSPGFADSDAVAWVGPSGGDDRSVHALAIAHGARPGVDVWQVRTAALALMGYMPGDWFLLDTNQSERIRAGDVVVAQVYDNNRGTAITVLRRYEPPVLVAASINPEEHRVHVVDGTNVVVRGKVVASWR